MVSWPLTEVYIPSILGPFDGLQVFPRPPAFYFRDCCNLCLWHWPAPEPTNPKSGSEPFKKFNNIIMGCLVWVLLTNPDLWVSNAKGGKMTDLFWKLIWGSFLLQVTLQFHRSVIVVYWPLTSDWSIFPPPIYVIVKLTCPEPNPKSGSKTLFDPPLPALFYDLPWTNPPDQG